MTTKQTKEFAKHVYARLEHINSLRLKKDVLDAIVELKADVSEVAQVETIRNILRKELK